MRAPAWTDLRAAVCAAGPLARTSRRCGWISSSVIRCWSSSSTSVACRRCAPCPTPRPGISRYATHGLRVISVHTPGYELSRDEDPGPPSRSRACASSTRSCWTPTTLPGCRLMQQRRLSRHPGQCGHHAVPSAPTASAPTPTPSRPDPGAARPPIEGPTAIRRRRPPTTRGSVRRPDADYRGSLLGALRSRWRVGRRLRPRHAERRRPAPRRDRLRRPRTS